MGWFDRRLRARYSRVSRLGTIGTVADVAPLRDVNRLLTRSGLDILKRTDSPGVRALIDVCMSGRSRPLNAGFIGFQMGPRINAAGRLSDASKGVEMLAASQYDIAYRIAVAVDEENQRRPEIQERMVDEAVASGGGAFARWGIAYWICPCKTRLASWSCWNRCIKVGG